MKLAVALLYTLLSNHGYWFAQQEGTIEIRPAAGEVGAGVGHQHPRAARREEQRVRAADPSARSGHDDGTTVESQLVHDTSSTTPLLSAADTVTALTVCVQVR